MPIFYHKNRRLPTNTGELECMAWDVMQNFTLIFHTKKKTLVNFRNVFVIFRNLFRNLSEQTMVQAFPKIYLF